MMKYDKLRIYAKLFIELKNPAAYNPNRLTEIEIPLESIRANHAENSIPSCVVSAATGRDVERLISLAGLSPTHLYAQQLRLPNRAIVKLKIVREDSSGPMEQIWPDDWFKVFEGWVSDVCPSMQVGARGFSIRILHWLANLDFSSPYSEDAFPTTPADFLFTPGTYFGTGAAGKFLVGTTDISKARTAFLANQLYRDFWDDKEGGGLKPFLQAISLERRMNWQQIVAKTGIPVGDERIAVTTNKLMQDALARFEPFEEYDPDLGVYVTEYQYGVPMKFRQDLASRETLERRTRLGVSQALSSPSLAGSTMWDRLISSFAGQFMFSIIPMVDRALVVPFTPWLQERYITIRNDEFDVLDYAIHIKRPIRAVTVVGNYGSYTKGRMASNPRGKGRRALGYFEPPITDINQIRSGMTMVVEPPGWINELLAAGLCQLSAPPSAKLALAQCPGIPNFLKEQLIPRINDEEIATGNLADALAKATYLQEVTKWRQAVLSTNLRFDISPGSIIAIKSAPDYMVDEILRVSGRPVGETLHGRVSQVSWSVSLANGQASASTVLHVAYLRSGPENTDPAFSAGDHPLWETTWRGAPLVGLPEFSRY